MTTLHDIYSRVTTDINDISFNVISKGEYLLMANQVALYLSRYIDLFVREVEYKATDEAQDFVIPIKLSATSTNLVNGQFETLPTDDHYTFNRLLKVVRKNQDCREISWQAVESAERGNAGFKVNDTQLGFRFYATRVTSGGDLQLQWIVPIEKDETVLIYALCSFLPTPAYSQSNISGASSTPKWSEFKDFTPIPDLVVSAFYAHMLEQALVNMLNRKEMSLQTSLCWPKIEQRKNFTNLDVT